MNERLLEDIDRNVPDGSRTNVQEREILVSTEITEILERNNLEELSVRQEGTIPRRESEVVRFSLGEIKAHFDENIGLVEKEFEIADILLESKGKEYAEPIWKSQLLFLESAFDFFMHEFNKFALTSMYDEVWPQTKEYKKIKVPLKLVEAVLKTGEPESWFLGHINETYKLNTMVSKKGFQMQLDLMGLKIRDIALCVYPGVNELEAINTVYHSLESLYERRNYLVHQSNRKHEDASFYEAEISRTVVENYIDFIKKLVDALISNAASL